MTGAAGWPREQAGSPAPTGGPSPDRLWLVSGELAAIVLIEIADAKGFIPISKTPFLLLLGWLSLRLRGVGWRDVGLAHPASWVRIIVWATAAGLALELFCTFVTVPLLSRFVGQPPDLSDFRPMVGSLRLVLLFTLINWPLAAFGEEMVYRGYLMNRIAGIGGGGRWAWTLSLVTVSALFGAGHFYQGPTGMIQESISGLLLGLVYLAARRSLWMSIVAHGISNQVAFLLIYFDRYPGV